MSSIGINASASGILRAEALNVSLTFTRTGPSTGRVTWNIPQPAAGCDALTQAYNGMVVTLATKPSHLADAPVDGTKYDADSNADEQLFAGDAIGDSLVVGALYNNVVAASLELQGLNADTAYYIVGYPVDKQLKYFREGVHGYAQPFVNRGSADTSGHQIVVLNPTADVMGADGTTLTGLDIASTYDLTVQVGLNPKPNRPLSVNDCILHAPQQTIAVNGADAQTVDDLVTELNRKLSSLEVGHIGIQPPNSGQYVWTASTKTLALWNGSSLVPVPCFVQSTDPAQVATGSAWFNPSTSVLSLWDGSAWSPQSIQTWSADPSTPTYDTIWSDGTNVYRWNGTTWCRTTTQVSLVDPSLALTPAAGSYWFDTDGELFQWNIDLLMWTSVAPIESNTDPSSLVQGSYWFDVTSNQLKVLSPLMTWALAPNFSATDIEPHTPAVDKLWFKLSTSILKQWDGSAWIELPVVIHDANPLIRNSCDLWWNPLTDTLKQWNVVSSTWISVSAIYTQATDPTNVPVITPGTVWITPSGQISVWSDGCFKAANAITTSYDPTTSIPVGTVWKNGNIVKIWTTGGWQTVTSVTSISDPTIRAQGDFWYDLSTMTLSTWNGVAWTAVSYVTATPTPQVGSKWINPVTGAVKQWNGSAWIVVQARVVASHDCNRNIRITDTTAGGLSFIRIVGGDLFSSMTLDNTLHDPLPGTDGASDHPTYSEYGVGTDGNDALRTKLANEIRYELGYPIVDVELAPEQIDYAISRALQELRARSSVAYKRGFFFMTILPEQQRYVLSSKVSGMNKIVDVLGVYRLTSSFVSSAHGSGVYGQIVLQHMYQMGSFDLLSFHLMSEYTKLMEMLFAARVTFTWNEQARELTLLNRFPGYERQVCIEATVERTEQDIMADRYTSAWIHKYATAMCRLMLAELRGKYASLPGAGGNISLNAGELRQAAQQEIQECIAEIESYAFDRPEEYGMGSTFTFG